MKDVQIAASINSIEAKVSLFRQEMESVNEQINYFKTQIDELYKKPDVPADFKEFKYKVDAFIQETSSRNDTSKILVDAIRSTIESIKNTLSQHGCEIRMLKDSMPIMEKQIADTKNDLSQKIVSITTAFSNRFDEHADKQKKQLIEFSNRAFQAPKSVAESNNALLDKLEMACLDGSNALLKASNIELSVKLLDRKLEKLELQLKKVELTQQA